MSELERRNDFRARIAELEDDNKRLREDEERLVGGAVWVGKRWREAKARIAELEAAVLAEREACATEAERFWECVTPDDIRHLQKRIAAAIRARPAP